LYETFDAYSGLVTRRSFLPDGTGADAISAALGMTAMIQRVLMLAAASTGPAATASVAGLVDIFTRVYSAQKDLAVLFSTSIPGVSNPQPRLTFAQRLKRGAGQQRQQWRAVTEKCRRPGRRGRRDPGTGPRPHHHHQRSGEAIIGGIEVTYRGSTRGETLVRNDSQPFGFLFHVVNRSNRGLSMQLQAGFVTPRESWNTSVLYRWRRRTDSDAAAVRLREPERSGHPAGRSGQRVDTGRHRRRRRRPPSGCVRSCPRP